MTIEPMSELSGFDLAEEIRAMEALKGVPIIAINSAGMRGRRQEMHRHRD